MNIPFIIEGIWMLPVLLAFCVLFSIYVHYSKGGGQYADE